MKQICENVDEIKGDFEAEKGIKEEHDTTLLSIIPSEIKSNSPEISSNEVSSTSEIVLVIKDRSVYCYNTNFILRNLHNCCKSYIVIIQYTPYIVTCVIATRPQESAIKPIYVKSYNITNFPKPLNL